MTETARGREAAISHRKAAALLREQGRITEAEAEIRKATASAPEDADAHAELGLTLMILGRPAEAEPSFHRALAISPDDVFSLANLGGALIRMNRPAEAEACFRRVLELQPGQPQALRNLGAILKDSARVGEAKAYLREAAHAAPSLDVNIQAHLALSPLTLSRADIAEQRAGYAAGLEAFAADPRHFPYRGESFNIPWFYLAYHGEDDRALQARTAEVLAAKAGLDPADQAPIEDWRPPAACGRRIRVGFCSEFLSDHTIGRLYRGLIRHLDRTRFEVVVLHSPYSKPAPFRAELDASADRAAVLPRAPDAQRQLIRQLKLDVLFFPDIGMAAPTWFLAHSRLAPVQATSWGHPDTTGAPAIDYYLSAESIEPPGADESYTERLVRLPRLPTFYETPAPPAAIPKGALKLPESGALYGCPQSLFKLHPDFDAVLAGIAEGDPDGHIVLIESPTAAWTEVLRRRWAAAHPVLLERVRFLPRLSHVGFMAHLAHLDVLLDPLHFGSGNTLYEAMALGIPIVTSPGRFMRSRIVAGAYSQMGISDPPVAASPHDYARLAVSLGRDAGRRAELRAELRAKASQHLYEDMAAVRSFEAFFAAAVDAAALGGHLPQGWRAVEVEVAQ